jgi:signal peptidase I
VTTEEHRPAGEGAAPAAGQEPAAAGDAPTASESSVGGDATPPARPPASPPDDGVAPPPAGPVASPTARPPASPPVEPIAPPAQPSGSPPAAPPDEPKKRSLRRLIVEYAATAVIALTIAFLVQAYVVKPYRVPTPSMATTIQPGDRVLIDRLLYDQRDVGRGDIVVFNGPSAVSDQVLLKRVSGSRAIPSRSSTACST